MSAEAAGVFSPYVPEGYRDQPRKILYIGKATDGFFTEEDAAKQAFEHKRSHFWSFADEVSSLADQNVQGRNNLVWSNIFKQGVKQGNPIGEEAQVQRTKATKDLRHEVEQYRPDLIVLVTVGYEEQVVKAAFSISDGETRDDSDGRLHEEKFDDSLSIWKAIQTGRCSSAARAFRTRSTSVPVSYVWMRRWLISGLEVQKNDSRRCGLQSLICLRGRPNRFHFRAGCVLELCNCCLGEDLSAAIATDGSAAMALTR